MKTILLGIGGMSDMPGREPTPLMEAVIPSLRVLAADGATGCYMPVYPQAAGASPVNSLLSLMGYDLFKGTYTIEELENIADSADFASACESARGIILPMFSSHGSLISPVKWARGIGKLAMLDTVDPTLEENPWDDSAVSIASEVIRRIATDEFVMVYIDWPAVAALAGDPSAKKEILEIIDRELVRPVADYVWHSDEIMNLAVTPVFATSWRLQTYITEKVPAIIYYNDKGDQTGLQDDFNEISAMRGSLYLPKPGSLMKILSMAGIFANRDEFRI